jgi:hypothetical protein
MRYWYNAVDGTTYSYRPDLQGDGLPMNPQGETVEGFVLQEEGWVKPELEPIDPRPNCQGFSDRARNRTYYPHVQYQVTNPSVLMTFGDLKLLLVSASANTELIRLNLEQLVSLLDPPLTPEMLAELNADILEFLGDFQV